MNLNLYFLVEGRRTEARVYPEWLKHLLPGYDRVSSPGAVTGTSYFLISGEGYPRLLDVTLLDSIRDINSCGQFHYFIVCLDADDCSVEDRRAEVRERIEQADERLDPSVTARVIVQNRSIETWFLGNKSIFPRAASGARFREFAAFYDVSAADPEAMPLMDGFGTHADFHHEYLKEMFRERSLSYSKTNPRVVTHHTYLQALRDRITTDPDHLQTLGEFVGLCSTIHTLTSPPAA